MARVFEKFFKALDFPEFAARLFTSFRFQTSYLDVLRGKKAIRDLVTRGSFFVTTIRSVEGKESSKEVAWTTYNMQIHLDAISVQRKQTAITRHAANLFPDPRGRVSVSRLVKATRSSDPSCSQKKMQALADVGRWSVTYPVYSTNCTSTRLALPSPLFPSQLFKTHRQLTARDKTSVIFLSVAREPYFKNCAK